MKFYFTVVLDGGDPVEVVASPVDQMAWERGGRDRSCGQLLTDLVGGSVRLVDIYSLAHAAMRRQGNYGGSLEEFEEAAEEVRLGRLAKEKPESDGDDRVEESPDDENPTLPGLSSES